MFLRNKRKQENDDIKEKMRSVDSKLNIIFDQLGYLYSENQRLRRIIRNSRSDKTTFDLERTDINGVKTNIYIYKDGEEYQITTYDFPSNAKNKHLNITEDGFAVLTCETEYIGKKCIHKFIIDYKNGIYVYSKKYEELNISEENNKVDKSDN